MTADTQLLNAARAGVRLQRGGDILRKKFQMNLFCFATMTPIVFKFLIEDSETVFLPPHALFTSRVSHFSPGCHTR